MDTSKVSSQIVLAEPEENHRPPVAIARGFAGVGIPGEAAESVAGTVRRLIADGVESWEYSSMPMPAKPTLGDVAKLSRLRRGPSTPIQECINKPLVIANIIIHPAASVDDDTGELHRFPRILLIGPDDTVYDCGAWSILEQVSELIARGFPPPWNPPIVATVSQKSTGDKRRIYVIDWSTFDAGRLASKSPK